VLVKQLEGVAFTAQEARDIQTKFNHNLLIGKYSWLNHVSKILEKIRVSFMMSF
jgi:hypothetical protein